ncbi:MAG: sugar nucleotide-binding protein, partial [Crocinitomicaceae bacterium]|nr:sugar nucleotide-binding protein [Crocinitomicaceae bacterium]
ETDKPNPLNVYGKSKLEGENNVLALIPEKAVIVRTSWLYSNHGNNFMNTMLRLFEERESLSIVNDQIGSPTSTTALAEVLWKVVGRTDVSGLYHWSCDGAVSWFDFAEAIEKKYGLDNSLSTTISIDPVTSRQYASLASRPKYSVLNSACISSLLDLSERDWEVCLVEVLKRRDSN